MTQSRRDFRQDDVSGASVGALENYELALARFQSWRDEVEAPLAWSLVEAPEFTMAHVLDAYRLLTSRDVQRVHQAHAVLRRLQALPVNEREHLHIGAIAAALADDIDTTQRLLDRLLRRFPRDVLALQIGHAFDYLTGDLERMSTRVASVLPHWTPTMPGYAAVLAMHAFSLTECGDYDGAVRAGERALRLDARDARAHHALAHVHEMSGAPEAGIRWMRTRESYWARGTSVAKHCWWHLALCHLSLGDTAQALALYDRVLREGRSFEVADLIDATSLLWRIELTEGQVGGRWEELADAWTPRVDDGYCSFNDVHAMLALVGARRWSTAFHLEQVLTHRKDAGTRHAETTRLVGLPASRAIIAFGRGDDFHAVQLLSAVPPSMRRIGGSQAQRDVLYLTLLSAIQRLRRPRQTVAVVPLVPEALASPA